MTERKPYHIKCVAFKVKDPMNNNYGKFKAIGKKTTSKLEQKNLLNVWNGLWKHNQM